MTQDQIETVLNHVLKDLFYKILRLQEKSVSLSSNRTLSRTEMHVLEIVQETPNVTLTQIAEEFGTTKATTSVTVSRLVKKKYLEKTKLEKDKRKSVLSLTEQGIFFYQKHKQFHDNMVRSVLHDFRIGEYPEIVKSLQALLAFFDRMDKENALLPKPDPLP